MHIFAVHYPGYPSSTSRAVDSLGGAQALLKLELRFRPDDPYSHPTFGELRPCNNNFLLKISKTQSIERNSDAELAADIVARVPQAYHFEGMVDYQHVVAVHADAARRKKRNWAEVEEPHFGEVYMFHYLYRFERAIKLREETNAYFLCQ